MLQRVLQWSHPWCVPKGLRASVLCCLCVYQIRVQDGPDDWGWGVAITALKRPTPAVSNTPGAAPVPGPAGAGPSSAASYIVDTLLLCAPVKQGEGDAEGGAGSKGPKLKPCAIDDPAGEMQVVSGGTCVALVALYEGDPPCLAPCAIMVVTVVITP